MKTTDLVRTFLYLRRGRHHREISVYWHALGTEVRYKLGASVGRYYADIMMFMELLF